MGLLLSIPVLVSRKPTAHVKDLSYYCSWLPFLMGQAIALKTYDILLSGYPRNTLRTDDCFCCFVLGNDVIGKAVVVHMEKVKL